MRVRRQKRHSASQAARPSPSRFAGPPESLPRAWHAARFAAGGRLFAFGNGGSATDAQQLATMFLDPGPGVPPLPAFGLANDTSVVTALCNDIGVDVVFARQLAAFGGKNDIAVGLSTSGNSDIIDYLFVAPSSSVHRIQEAQTTIYHVLWELTIAELTRPGAAS